MIGAGDIYEDIHSVTLAKLRVSERTSREWRSKALMRANKIAELEAEIKRLTHG